MKPLEKRERLFRHSRPNLRAFEFYDGEDYHKDIKILWVAHSQKPFKGFPDDQEGFAKQLMDSPEMVIIEDRNKQYKDVGPIGVIWVLGDDWKVEPHVEFFSWATKKNILRGCISFFQWSRNTRKIGCIVVYSLKASKNLFDHVCKYGVLHYVGKIVNGDSRGDEYLYSVKGKKR